MAPLAPGQKAPPFRLKGQDGRTVTLSSFSGRKLLLYFYPKADTPGCTKQACSVRDALPELAALGVAAVGISPDSPARQSEFDAGHSLGFPLLSDEDHAVAQAYGAWGEKSMYGRKYEGIIRSAFLIDEAGKVAAAWYGVSPAKTMPNVMAALAN